MRSRIMFLDHATIQVTGGDGGRGSVAWRREKYVPMGGPAGGDGADGADVIMMADENTDTLSDYASRKKFSAERGEHGLGSKMAGARGDDLVLKVPPGTLVYEYPNGNANAEPVLFADLANHGDEVLLARGGRGGYGNAHFKTSTRQGPDFAELGEPGETRLVKLELKLVADVGIIGYPSVGKSTLISVVSAAKPKIADYPFTTLVPNLGVVQVGERSFVLCDVPGLIEGASEGKGLGHQFLRHIERCGALLHVLDLHRAMTPEGTLDAQLLVKDYHAIRKELEAFSPTLAAKRELVILNKVDLTAEPLSAFVKALKKAGIEVFAQISAATTKGTAELMQSLLPIVLDERTKREQEIEEEQEKDADAIPVLRPGQEPDRMGSYRIETDADGTVRIRGKRLEQFVSMTDFTNPSAVDRFHDVLKKVGVQKSLRRAQAKQGSVVYIGKVRVDSYIHL